MTLKKISDYCLKNGIMVYEKRNEIDGRKKIYRINVPVFTDGNVIPTSNYDYLVGKPQEIIEYVNKLLDDDKFRHNIAQWVRTWTNFEL